MGWNMEIPRDAEGFGWGLGDLGVKFRAIIQLGRNRDSKVRDDLLNEKVQDCFCPFIGGGECLHLPQEGVH